MATTTKSRREVRVWPHEQTCTIVRFRQDGEREVLRTGVSHAYALEWCNDPTTKGPNHFDGWWFDDRPEAS